MPYNDASAAEVRIIEDIETVANDPTITNEEFRKGKTEYLWKRLERLHGSKVLILEKPNGEGVIHRPNIRD